MGFLSGLTHAVTHPVQALEHLAKNPASAIVPKKARNSPVYTSVVRPAVKVGTAAGEGFITGGYPGAIAAAGASLASGGATSKPFNPVHDVATPVVVGGTAGALSGQGAAGEFIGGGTGSGGAGESAASAFTNAYNSGAGLVQSAKIGLGQALANGVGTGTISQNAASAVMDVMSTTPSAFLHAVATYGPAALKIAQGVTGLSATKQQQQLATDAQNAALSGNAAALQNALASLRHSMDLRRGAARAAIGAQGLLTTTGGGGNQTILDLIDGQIARDQGLQHQYLTTMAGNQSARLKAQAASELSQLAANKVGNYADIARGVISGAGKLL